MENRIVPENENANNKPPKNDASEVVRRHLEDKNHQITDEDIRNVRIVADDGEPTTIGAEAEAKFVATESEENEKEEGDESRLPSLIRASWLPPIG